MADTRTVHCAHPNHAGPPGPPLAIWHGDLTVQTPPALICDTCIGAHGHPGPQPPVHRPAP